MDNDGDVNGSNRCLEFGALTNGRNDLALPTTDLLKHPWTLPRQRSVVIMCKPQAGKAIDPIVAVTTFVVEFACVIVPLLIRQSPHKIRWPSDV